MTTFHQVFEVVAGSALIGGVLSLAVVVATLATHKRRMP